MTSWVDVRPPPKCLPDVLEAYIGAIFVDSRYDYAVVQAFFRTPRPSPIRGHFHLRHLR